MFLSKPLSKHMPLKFYLLKWSLKCQLRAVGFRVVFLLLLLLFLFLHLIAVAPLSLPVTPSPQERSYRYLRIVYSPIKVSVILLLRFWGLRWVQYSMFKNEHKLISRKIGTVRDLSAQGFLHNMESRFSAILTLISIWKGNGFSKMASEVVSRLYGHWVLAASWYCTIHKLCQLSLGKSVGIVKKSQ